MRCKFRFLSSLVSLCLIGSLCFGQVENELRSSCESRLLTGHLVSRGTLLNWKNLPAGRFLFTKTDYAVVQDLGEHGWQKFHFQEHLNEFNEFESEVLCSGLPLEQVSEFVPESFTSFAPELVKDSLMVPVKIEMDHISPDRNNREENDGAEGGFGGNALKVTFRNYLLNQAEQRFQVLTPKIYNERKNTFASVEEFLEFMRTRGVDLKIYQTGLRQFNLVVSRVVSRKNEPRSFGVQSRAIVNFELFQ